MVYCPCKIALVICPVLFVCLLDGSTVPDAYVHTVQYGKHAWFNTLSIFAFHLLGLKGLAVFMFLADLLRLFHHITIDGCNPLRHSSPCCLPIMKPTYISVGGRNYVGLEWHLLPYLFLDRTKFKTILTPDSVLLRGYGRVEISNVCLHHDGYYPNCHYIYSAISSMVSSLVLYNTRSAGYFWKVLSWQKSFWRI